MCHIQKVRDNIYIVQENDKENNKFDFLCDMELGICSCTTGSTGAACQHQAAVAKHFKLVSVNIPPIDSSEMRHLFAVKAKG